MFSIICYLTGFWGQDIWLHFIKKFPHILKNHEKNGWFICLYLSSFYTNLCPTGIGAISVYSCCYSMQYRNFPVAVAIMQHCWLFYSYRLPILHIYTAELSGLHNFLLKVFIQWISYYVLTRPVLKITSKGFFKKENF